LHNNIDLDTLALRSKSILKLNDLGVSTKPSPKLYPHQWNWDSAFIAIGLSHSDPNRAQTEIKSMLRAQWKTGMIPHIVFNPDAVDYHPGPEYWKSHIRAAPASIRTSGITQPPVLAQAALDVYQHSPQSVEDLALLSETYPALLKEANFLYGDRDPFQEGLSFICHPWESGMDNSPCWDIPLNHFEMDYKPEFMRKDRKDIPANQRPSDDEYSRYSYLVQAYGIQEWQQSKIVELNLFLVQSVLFNVLQLESMQALARIAKIIDLPRDRIDQWIKQSQQSFENKLWDDESGRYLDFDLSSKTLIKTDNISQFLPLFAGIPTPEKAEDIISRLQSQDYWPDKGWGICTQSRSHVAFDLECYWRGPVWINTNWMIIKGLEKYQHPDLAKRLAHETLDLVDTFGFFEYFNSDTGQGLGSDNFSWTAALVIDLIAAGYS
jgi:neutral trehalase